MPSDKLIKLIDKAENVRAYLDNNIPDVIKMSEESILSANVSQLSDYGINSQGVSIMDYAPYTAYTIKKKQEKGQRTDIVTLKDTGSFQSDFYIQYNPDGFYIFSKDEKAGSLGYRYTNPRYQSGFDNYVIFGLTSENWAKIIENEIRPNLIQQTKELLYA